MNSQNRWYPSARGAERHVRQVTKLLLNYRGERRLMFQRYVFDLLRQVTPSVAVVGADATYYVSTTDVGLSWVVFSQGSYEQELMASCLELVEDAIGRSPLMADRTFVDVGANIGTSTIPALRVFGARDAIVFEPAPMNFHLLRSNIIVNELDDRVQAFQMALSDHNGSAAMEVAEHDWGDHRLRNVTGLEDDSFYQESSRPTITVPTARFDDLAVEHCWDIDRIGLFWMDAQGHEGHILAGAQSVMASDVPLIIEYWPYGLRRAQGLGLLYEALASRCRRVIDARASMSEGRVVDVPLDDLGRLERSYDAPNKYTDLILIK